MDYTTRSGITVQEELRAGNGPMKKYMEAITGKTPGNCPDSKGEKKKGC